jgi:hypothetical protein
MRKVFLFAAMLSLVTACKKTIQVHNISIVGKWKLSESLADPGDGSGTCQPADLLHHAAFLLFPAGPGTL